MHLSHQEFVAQCGPLLRKVFDEEPIADVSRFVASAAYELRRSVGRGERMEFVSPSRPRLPPWLNSHFWLGPYEQSLLHTLLVLSTDISIVRGGTGSGKSSLVRMLLHHAEQLCPTQDWLTKYGVDSFMHAIDLSNQRRSLTTHVDSPNDRDAQLVELLDIVQVRLRAALHQLTRNNASLLARLYRDALWGVARYPASGVTSDVETVRHILQARLELDKKAWSALPPKEQVARYEAAAEELHESSSRMIAALLPFATIGERHLDDERPFLLIFDNLDQLPAYLQLDLCAALRSFFVSGATANCGVRVVLFLRLSSAVDPAGAFSDVTVASHGCPDPASITFFRVSDFLLAPNSYTSFANMTRECQRATLARLTLLWLALSDNGSCFSGVLSALAGTNIRNGFQYAKKWCLSSDMSLDNMLFDWRKTLDEVVRPLMLAFVCDEIGDAVADGLRVHLSSRGLKQIFAEWPAKQAVPLLGVRVCEVVMEVLHDAGLLVARNVEILHARKRLSKEVMRLIEERSAQSIDQVATSAPVWEARILELAKEFENAFAGLKADGEAPSESAVELLTSIFEGAESMWPSQSKRIAQQRDLEITSAALWKTNHLFKGAVRILRAVRAGDDKSETLRVASRGQAQLRRRLRQSSNALANRYVVVRSLMDRGEEQYTGKREDHNAAALYTDAATEDLPPQAFNAFTVDMKHTCPAGLRVLARLFDVSEFRPGAMAAGPWSVARLLEDCEIHGYSEMDVRHVLEEMVRVDRRLVFSGISDWFEGVDRFFAERNRAIRLSWAGYGYYASLLRVPAFLQWSFEAIGDVEEKVRARLSPDYSLRSEVLEYRLEAALIGFGEIIDDEHKRFEKAWPKFSVKERRTQLLRHEPDEQNITLSILFDTMDEFISTLIAHAGNVASSRARANRVFDLARRWVAAGENYVKRHREVFGGPDNKRLLDWEFVLEQSHKKLALAAK